MSKRNRSAAFSEQMAEAMGELRSIMALGQSPTGNGRLTARTIEVTKCLAGERTKAKSQAGGLKSRDAKNTMAFGQMAFGLMPR